MLFYERVKKKDIRLIIKEDSLHQELKANSDSREEFKNYLTQKGNAELAELKNENDNRVRIKK